MLQFKGRGLLAFIVALSAAPVLAQEANFQSLTFSGTKGIVTGSTGGSSSLPAIIESTHDRNNNPCIGFGSQTPDHILTLDKDYPQLRIVVDSGGRDTTIAIKGPNNLIRCGDDTGSSKDASVEDKNWKAGKYRIWIGSVESGQKGKYTLTVQ